MPGIARDSGTDVAGGPLIAGSSDVFANFLPAVRVGDAVAGHGKAPHAAPTMAQGSGTVFVNNIPVCRAGDRATCGHTATGSSNVFADGGSAGGGGGGSLATGASGGGNGNVPTAGSTGAVAYNGNRPSTGNPLIDALLRSGPDPNFKLEDLEPDVLERQRGIAIQVLVNGGYGPDGFVCSSTDEKTGALIYVLGDAGLGAVTRVVFPDGTRIDRIPLDQDVYDVLKNAAYSGPTTGTYGISEDRINAFIVARNTTGELGGIDPDPTSQSEPTTWRGADGVDYPALRSPDGSLIVPDAHVIVTPDGVALPA